MDMTQNIALGNDPLPLATPISGAIQVRAPVVAAVVVGRDIDFVGVVRRDAHL